MPRKPPHGDYNERELRRQFAGRLLELIDRLYEGKKRDFAKACGISESTITEYTQAKIAPALINLIKIRKATNVSLDWLLCGDESEGPLSQEEIAAKYKISPTTVRAVGTGPGNSGSPCSHASQTQTRHTTRPRPHPSTGPTQG